MAMSGDLIERGAAPGQVFAAGSRDRDDLRRLGGPLNPMADVRGGGEQTAMLDRELANRDAARRRGESPSGASGGLADAINREIALIRAWLNATVSDELYNNMDEAQRDIEFVRQRIRERLQQTLLRGTR